MKKEVNLVAVVAIVLLAAVLIAAGVLVFGGDQQPAEPTETTNPAEATDALPTEPERIAMHPVDLAEMAKLATVTVETTYGTGSGFFIDDRGTVITCYHVIDGAEEISVSVSDGGVYKVESITDFDDAYDIAVLKIDIASNHYLKLCEERPRQGEDLYAIGSSLGFLSGTFTGGITSSVSRRIGVIDYIQTTAAISSGNSGGPLINAYGEVVGICAAKYTGGENLNLAISVEMLDNMAMDKNWSVSKYKEWYAKEIRRSYLMYNYTEEAFQYSLTNTYHHVTGRECFGSDSGWDKLYGYSGTFVSGYCEDLAIFYYPYDVAEFDQYTDYLKENGYEFIEVTEYDVGTSYTYGNEFYGFYMQFVVTKDKKYIALQPYCY